MDAKNILQAKWLDILFDGRNKMYGAYHLRKFYHQKLITAMLITFSLMILLFFLLKSAATNMSINTTLISIPDTEWTSIPPQNIAPPPIVKPVAQSAESASSRERYVKPVITYSNDVAVERIKSLSAEAAISTTTRSGLARQQVQVPVDLPPLIPVETTTSSMPETGQVATKVDQSALFPGGLAAWKRYLERNLDAASTGAPAGVYVVVVKFIVGKDGKIREVLAETSNGFGMEEEAMEVIRKGPKWIPAVLNAEQVEAWHRQSITFVITGQ